MSGIVGILHLDGAPIDRRLLGRMTGFMTFRGPDAQEIWVDGNIGFGHTLLKTTEESERERQPFTLDGRIWIVADARVDARRDLIGNLRAKGHEDLSSDATDVELILRAYQVWGEDCVEHLLGDFAFGIWDGPRQRLFCARDHLGVKPFFYAHVSHTVIFSNTLDCIRQHPAVSEKLNDLAIADFLLFDLNQDPATTSFADIQRMPPAHRATWSAGGVRMSRYWTLPIDEPLYYRRADDYVDRFKELLHTAVGDRLRTNKVGVFMSGGLDSTTLAATTCRMVRAWSAPVEVHAFTTVLDGIDHDERHYAQIAADSLHIPIHLRDLTDNAINPEWIDAATRTSEPFWNPMNLTADRNYFTGVSMYARVCFNGEGPDDLLTYEWRPYLLHLFRRRSFGRIVSDVVSHMYVHRRIPLVPSVPRILNGWLCGPDWTLQYPKWLHSDLESRLQLRERWEARQRQILVHRVRPIAHRSLQSVRWGELFRDLDPAHTNSALEVRYPFIDLRLIRYFLRVPVIPWCRSKHLIRHSMKAVLPKSVICRPKRGLASDPAWRDTRRYGVPPLVASHSLSSYINTRYVPRNAGNSMIDFRVDFRPYALSHWLHNLERRPHIDRKDVRNESASQYAS